MTTKPSKSRRGFAAMDRETHSRIASKGGKASHATGTAHEFDSAEGAAAGRKGGLTVSQDRAHMARIGRLGGMARLQRKLREQNEIDAGVREP